MDGERSVFAFVAGLFFALAGMVYLALRGDGVALWQAATGAVLATATIIVWLMVGVIVFDRLNI